MAIPDYQTLMLPLLKKLSDTKTQLFKDVVSGLADEFELTAVERAVLLSSGGATTFSSRASWAKTYLKKAGLVSQSKRGFVEITPSGRRVLENPPARIDANYLQQFATFAEFRFSVKEPAAPPLNNHSRQQPESLLPELTPEEVIESAYSRHWDALADEVIERVKNCSPAYFERLVVQLPLKMGYGGSRQEAGQALGRSGDGGIDGIIKEPLHNSLRSVVSRTRAAYCVIFLTNSHAIGKKTRLVVHPEPTATTSPELCRGSLTKTV